MSRRARAAAFGCAALACAGLAAAVAGSYRADLESQLGPLHPVVVARERLVARRPLRPADVTRLVEVRRVPERFIPAGVLSDPREAVGLAPAAAVPAGAYVLATQLMAVGKSDRDHRRPRLATHRKPVEVTVSGAEALAATGGDPSGSAVDVVVTTEPGPGGNGRTYVAAAGVRLLALTRSSQGADALPGPSAGVWTATLALSRAQALRIIQAENFARQVRLIPH